MKSQRALAALAIGTLVAGGLAVAAPAATAAPTPVTITPNPAVAGEPFEGWGTSLVWFANATGNYPENVRQELFDKVFGDDGLRLNIARYNIGGGNATDVPSYLRPGGAVEGWWNPDLKATDAQGEITSTYADRKRYAAAWNADDPASYNFDADATQRWWIEALRDRITKWEAFSNSPPYFLTESGYVSGGINNATSEQLAVSNMDDFATYLVTVVDRLEAEYGIDFSTLDPFNEPNTNYWSTRLGANGWPTSASRQEGAHIGPERQDAMIKVLADELASESTATDVKISAMDETNPSIFTTNWNAWSGAAKAEVDQLNVHTYGTGDRLVVRDIAKASDKPLWMSEVEGNWDPDGFNQVNIENGLGMAGRIVDDLRELEPSAWVFWQPVEDLYNMQKVENLNWGSIFVDFDCNADGNSKRRLADGEADPSCKVLTNSKYNTVRNFTQYIRPGDRLIPTNDTQSTAALSSSGDAATIVHVNSGTSERALTVDLSKFGTIAPGATVTPIVTTESPASDVTANGLVAGQPVPINANTKSAVVTVPAQSVTTLVLSGVSGVATDAPQFEDGHSYQLVGVQSGRALSGETNLTIRSAATTADAVQAQTWTVQTLSGDGTNRERVALVNGNGRYLAVSGTSTALVTASKEQAAAEARLQWIPSTTDGKTFSLVSASAERVLDVNGQGTADGTTVGTWTSNNGTNQRWTLADTEVTGVQPVVSSTIVGVAPQLPAQATLIYRGGVERTAAVTWDLDGADWSTPGSVTVTGAGTDLFGSAFSATATVEVGGFAGTDPVSLTTYAGATLAAVQGAAPATVPSRIGSSDNRFPATVTWGWSALSDADFAAPGVVVVPGVAASNQPDAPTLEATLSVIVTAPSQANVAPTSTATATFTESSSYGVDRTKNGILDDKGWSNWRSGTKNAQDTLTYTLREPATLGSVAVNFYRDGTNSWARQLRVETRLGSGAWTPTATIPVTATATGPAPIIEVPLGGVKADQVRVVMDAQPATHMIVSEVRILALAPSPAGVADLARLTLDAAPLDGFSADTTSYALERSGSAWPRIGAVAVDSAARVDIVQPADAGGAGSVRVTAPDGTVRTYTVAVNRTVALADPTITGDALLGETLTATAGAADPETATTAFQWTRDGTDIAGATAASFRIAAADIGRAIAVRATASAPAFTAASATSEPVVPVEVRPGDGSKSAPGRGVLSSDNGWDTGLQDGDYAITMNLWWGTNGTLLKLYENGTLISTQRLTAATPAAQAVSVAVSGRANGTYVYTGELVNSSGKTATQPVAVTVRDANPGKPSLSHDNWDRDGSFTLTADLWWGTNATSYAFYEGSTQVASGDLTAKTPVAQRATASITGVSVGTHTYTVVFTNAAGQTTSAPVKVVVAR